MIGALWVAAILLLGWIAYAYVRGAARSAAAERLAGVSEQLGGLLRGNGQTMAAGTRTIAADSALRRYLDATQAREQAVPLTAAPATAAALAALARRQPADRAAAVQLRDRSGRVILSSGPDASALDTFDVRSMLPGQASGADTTVGPFLTLGDSLVVPVVASVPGGGERLGYVVQWLYIGNSADQRKAMLGLIGPESDLSIGSSDAGTWTNLQGAVAAPPGAVTRWKGVTEYTRAGIPRVAMARPVSGTPWYVVVELSARRIDAPARAFLGRALVVGFGVLLLGLLGVWLLTRRITGRLGRLTDAAESINAADARAVGPEPRGDELVRLGTAFDRMATRVRDTHQQLEANVAELQAAREQFAHTQRMEAVGRLAGGVAHDFNNLLTVILGEVDLALTRPRRDPAEESALLEIRRAGERAALLTQQLLSFSRRQVVAPAEIDMNELVIELEKMLARLIGENVQLRTVVGASDAWIRADRGQMEQVLVNLVVNARDAMPAGGTITVNTARVGQSVVVSVTDTGTGMTDDVRRHLFEPFFTTKERGKGSGLGLATSYGIVHQAGGHIEVRTALGRGTTMDVILPVVAAPATEPAAETPSVAFGHETVLIVEDEPGVQRIAARVLGLKGYQVLTAASGEQALAVLRDRHRAVDLLLTDVVLQGMGGRELADAAVALRPRLRVLFVSGYTDDIVLQHRLVAEDVHFLAKPYSPDALVQRVREVLDSALA